MQKFNHKYRQDLVRLMPVRLQLGQRYKFAWFQSVGVMHEIQWHAMPADSYRMLHVSGYRCILKPVRIPGTVGVGRKK